MLSKKFVTHRGWNNGELMRDFEIDIKEKEEAGYRLHSWNYLPFMSSSPCLTIMAIYEREEAQIGPALPE
jgi:hypothetical protein